MFFVGATGQLLTLLLTVCLPFVFLFTTQPKIELIDEALSFENIQIQQKIVSFENDSFLIQFDLVVNFQDIKIACEDTFIQKTPNSKVRIKWKSFCAESSGNKAPPATNCFAS
ncbi:hypothetical protein MASR2M47_06790 [Draconibacterium sp.]|jgi:hypothetical protein